MNTRLSMLAAVDALAVGLTVSLGVLLISSAIVLWLVADRAASGALGPNRWAGIRTESTMESPAAWIAAHRAAQGAMRIAAVILGSTGVAVAILGSTTDLLPLIALVGIGLMLGALIRGTIRGIRAAKAVNRDG